MWHRYASRHVLVVIFLRIYCSTGFSITPEDLYIQVTNYITSHGATGWASLSSVLGGVKGVSGLRWANPLELKNSVEKAFTEKFGAKEASKPKGKVREFKVR
jgi:glutaminyl-tRNA synthetase